MHNLLCILCAGINSTRSTLNQNRFLHIQHIWLFSIIHTAPGPTCQRYTGALCRHVGTIAMDYVYINTSIANQDVYEFYLRSELRYLDQFPRCRKAMTDLLCRMNFPLCDYSSHTPKPRPVSNNNCIIWPCKHTCDSFVISFVLCQHVAVKKPVSVTSRTILWWQLQIHVGCIDLIDRSQFLSA